jgi:hypothetical protein
MPVGSLWLVQLVNRGSTRRLGGGSVAIDRPERISDGELSPVVRGYRPTLSVSRSDLIQVPRCRLGRGCFWRNTDSPKYETDPRLVRCNPDVHRQRHGRTNTYGGVAYIEGVRVSSSGSTLPWTDRSIPAQKVDPAPVTTTAATSSSRGARKNASSSSSTISAVRVSRWSRRLRIIVRIRSDTSYRIVW